MRTIKFRGKKISGNWTYGYYNESRLPVKYSDENVITKSRILSGNENNFIIPESIGQFTGLHDKNGKEIYEGDILEDTLGRKKLVEYYKDGFWLNASFDGAEWCLRQVNSSSKIIGNIYENPELISKTPTHEQ